MSSPNTLINNNETNKDSVELDVQYNNHHQGDQSLGSLVSNYHSNSTNNNNYHYTTSTNITSTVVGGTNKMIIGQQQRTTNQASNSNYDGQIVDIVGDPYSSYSSSRYSTASSSQYPSLGRNVTINSTQIQLNNSESVSTIISNQLSRANPSMIPVVENNDCYLLTAQPVRVDSNCSSSSTILATSGDSSRGLQHHLQGVHHQPQQLNNNNNNQLMMTTSLDSAASLMNSSSPNMCISSSSAAMFNSLMSSSATTSVSETIGDIVWPSMHQPNSMLIHTPLNKLATKEIVVTGSKQVANITANANNNPPVGAAQLLTEEGNAQL